MSTIQSQVLNSFSVDMSNQHICTITHNGKTTEIPFLQFQLLTDMRTRLEYAYMSGDNTTISQYEKVLAAWLPTLVA